MMEMRRGGGYRETGEEMGKSENSCVMTPEPLVRLWLQKAAIRHWQSISQDNWRPQPNLLGPPGKNGVSLGAQTVVA